MSKEDLSLDPEIRRSIWNGSVPIMFNLASNEVSTTETPRPLFLNVPRCSYFPAKPLELIKEHFSSLSSASGNEVWLEFKSNPLKWHYPVGVLFDLLSDNELPWSITVHFQNFPTDQLLRLSNSGTSNTRSYFMNSLKESTYVKQNGIKVINDFGIKESDSIWEGLYDGHFEKFFNVSNLIVQQTNQIPVRILRPNFPIMQYPCEWKNSATGEMVTLGQALNSCKLGLNLDSPESEILVQGIRPPMETPLFWMSQHLSHPDGFLYIVIKD